MFCYVLLFFLNKYLFYNIYHKSSTDGGNNISSPQNCTNNTPNSMTDQSTSLTLEENYSIQATSSFSEK